MESLWQYSTVHNSACKVIEEQTLWGQTVCRVWLPNQDAVVRVPRSALRPLSADLQPEIEAGRIAYVAAAAKVAEVLEGSTSATEGHVLLAPMESNVIPLPHQIHALSRAISGDRVRYLLADEVGLGKTIEAGLVMRELKLRGLVRRTLVVSPKGIATQWVAEMQTHFNEQFQLVLGDDIGTLQRLAPGADHRSSAWSMFDQVIVSLDSVKPMDKRRGWTAERVAEYNRSRFEDLITAGWDLVIVDEAHRLGGSTDQVARYKLGKGLAEAAPYVLLLSATPHQGKTDAFHRLMNLLDDDAFPDMDSVSRDRVAPYVIRTEKRKAIDADGKPLFKPRRTQMAPVAWESRHQLQQLLYEAVTDYVREGYNQALREKKRHIGFLMILMQRLVVSSTRAIRTTLERRLAALKDGEQQASLRLAELENGADGSESPDDEIAELYDMDGQELLDELLKSHVSALQSEGSHVETLLDAAVRCEQAGPDAKAEALIEWIYKLQAEENEPDLKVLIFTEFVPTQQMLKEFLEARGISVVTLNGSMAMEERGAAQDAFRKSHRVLVSTDAGGEGLNLQFAHVIINYDIPWNPMRLEQRIGRVDRIGQPKTVQAINFVFEDSVEFRVREVLEQKLSVIFDEFGIDKTGDVLDSAQAGELFEDVFASAILNPDGIETSVDHTVARIRDEIQQVRESSAIYGISEEPDVQTAERLRSHPLPHWVERMTVGYLNSHGGAASRKRSWWDLNWPDGQEHRKAVFSAREADRLTDATLLNLENSRVRGLALNLPQVAAGQPLPCVTVSGLPASISGLWGLFEIRLQAGMHQKTQLLRIPMVRRGYVSVFLSEEGKLFLPTARHIWDALQTAEAEVQATLGQDDSITAHERLQIAAEQAGQELFDALQQAHLASVNREEERGMVAFTSRRKAIERVGLPEVRQYRLARCAAEENEWRHELQSARQIVPEIRSLLMLRIIKGGAQ
ncbi:DEAD/DEAH box helicase [Desulfococcus multivorans]|uniref:SNF2-related protein n=2 Tax=Desulfococcus multivorans TaxID=897 RepID=S7VC37_DESML|nr:helicase-related protein [Desulfococcus multivorans]AOY57425.1 VrlO: virulence associated protein [Desulfococcus multivorans]AQU99864.1 helicase [Desulfococcus multivorans]EPR42053.1 SNF2-related protein [Desulfococcus multivorans DSM 2059]CAJ13779.1 virulence associated protein [Desulfococcus multivorans]SKA09571.1 SNF2 family N-terminal domain-containing protein [Desulfococcus multivorans DSM 2059]